MKHIRIIQTILFPLLLLSTAFASQAQSLSNFFIEGMKGQIQLDRSARIEILSSKEAITINGGKAQLLKYNENNNLSIQTSSQGYFNMKRWEVKEDIYFGMAWNICTPQCDGSIKLVKMVDGNSIDLACITASIKDFVNADSLKTDETTPEEFESHLENTFIRYEFTDSDTIWAINNTEAYLDEERQRRYHKYWKGNALPLIFSNGTLQKGEAILREESKTID